MAGSDIEGRQPPALQEARARVLAELELRLSLDQLDGEEYARRSELARNATSASELRELLGPEGESALVENEPVAPVLGPHEVEHVVAIMGGAQRRGAWEPPARVSAFALMGGVELDFREADLLEGTTQVDVLAVMGGASIVVPPDVEVRTQGSGFMGAFKHLVHHAEEDDAPMLLIKGLALMGGVEIKVKERRKRRLRK